ncbi:TIGR03668 family PPOX class F420-dependent oxidoreductase [Jiangella asiatica]|uniref:TIGR03668 family PPOX class F420-dependent oxidoreductase n=1 Tax=Jiangella asiatica TaxID=2530372 RepID=A0A4V2YYW6_9ACTN|nr:TIGR03668 family PPOX class F420-dependent oxidoreductase [Jiangella asiatica]TDD94757.1 TIGR03668 family PPOX class F420-dependent oxidoreductase [Jiangella asiatica]
MRLAPETCRARLTAARVARLATTGHDGAPHLVPVTFAVTRADVGAAETAPAPSAVGRDQIVIAIDQKPKSTVALRRLRNIAENPKVTVLGDHYDEDWTQLWWVRADGLAIVVGEGPERDAAIAGLCAKYPQYRADPPRGPAIRITVTAWSGWAFAG